MVILLVFLVLYYFMSGLEGTKIKHKHFKCAITNILEFESFKSNSRPMSEWLPIVCLNFNCPNFSLIGILTFVFEKHKRLKWKYIVCLHNELYNE